MHYRVVMSDTVVDKKIELTIEAKSVFDAIDIATNKIPNPAETELIEAIPLF